MRRAVSALLSLIALLAADAARAACNVTATGIAFGRYDVLSLVPRDSTGTVSVYCDDAPPPDVAIAIGPSANGSGFTPRKMRNASGPDLLNYNLYTTSSASVIWGDGTAGTSTVVLERVRKIHKNKPPVVTTIYGRIPARQNVSPGNYSDSLTVTITW